MITARQAELALGVGFLIACFNVAVPKLGVEPVYGAFVLVCGFILGRLLLRAIRS